MLPPAPVISTTLPTTKRPDGCHIQLCRRSPQQVLKLNRAQWNFRAAFELRVNLGYHVDFEVGFPTGGNQIAQLFSNQFS